MNGSSSSDQSPLASDPQPAIRRWQGALAWFLLGLAVLLRLWGAGSSNPFWTDEYNHVFAASAWLDGRGMVLPSGVVVDRAPLYSWMVAQSFRFLGESEFSARLPSLLFSFATLLVIWFYGRRVLGLVPALFALGLFGIDDTIVTWGRTCRMYAPMQFANVALLLLAMDATLNGHSFRARSWLLRGIAAAGLAAFGMAMHLLFATGLAGLMAGLWGVALANLRIWPRPRLAACVLGIVALGGTVAALHAVPHLRGYLRLGHDYTFGDESASGIVWFLHSSGKLLPIVALAGLLLSPRDPRGVIPALSTLVGVTFFVGFSVFQADRYYMLFQDAYLLLGAWSMTLVGARLLAIERVARLLPWQQSVIAALAVALTVYDSPYLALLESPARYQRRIAHADLASPVREAFQRAAAGDAFAATEHFALYYYAPAGKRQAPLHYLRQNDLEFLYPRCVVRDGITYERLLDLPLIDSTARLEAVLEQCTALWVIADDSKWRRRLEPELREAIESRADLVLGWRQSRLLRLPGGAAGSQ